MIEPLQRSQDDSQIESKKQVTGWNYFKVFLTISCTVPVIILVVQNAEAVRVNLFFWNIELSMALVIFLALVIGAGIGAFACGRLMWKRS